jgi:serine/threonine protein kinase/Tol biopolymer transport system component/DNA-binding winged helix-turn-helix (wHTH) protein
VLEPPKVLRVGRFGPYEVNLTTGELRKHGIRLKLQDQPFRILVLLLARPGKLVMREEIRQRLWPSGTFVDFDNGLNTALSRLREALGDSAESPRYIETLARRGYRWMVAVDWMTSRSADLPIAVSVEAPCAAEAIPDNLIGKRVSNYRILELLGAGGMGVVYKAEDLKLGRRVALKFLPQELVRNSLALDRFEREARAASALNHPNICTIYEFEEYEGQPFIVMELLQGHTLGERIGNASAPLQTNEVIDLAIQIADGLDAAHQKGIIHRDIKPTNIFLTNRGEAKILDFGLAKIVDFDEILQSHPEHEIDESFSPEHLTTLDSADLTLTRTGAMIGSVSYMSPEQVRGEKLDCRTDLFSFGAVLYEMATGRMAFPDSSAALIHDETLNREPLPSARVNPEVPPKLKEVTNKALEKDKKLRYQSAADMRTDLQRLKKDSESGRAAAGSATVYPEKEGGVPALFGFIREHRLSMAAGFLLVGMLFGAVLYAARSLRSSNVSRAEIMHKQFTFSGNAISPAISPDGLFVAYVSTKPGEQEKLIVQALNGTKVELAHGNLGGPRWSPDGSEVLFANYDRAVDKMGRTANSSGDHIYVVSRLGGVARPISQISHGVDGATACWLASDGSQIVTAGQKEPSGFKGVRIVNKLSGEEKEVRLSEYTLLGDIDCSARAGLILAVTETSYKYQIRTFKPDGSDERKLVEESDFIYTARWSPTGDSIYYSRRKGSTNQLLKLSVTRRDAEAAVLADGLQSGGDFTLSADGSRLAYTREDLTSNLWRVDLPTAEKRAEPDIRRLTSGTSLYSSPSFSPDGHWLAFSHGPVLDETNIFKMPVAGGEPVQLTFFKHSITASPVWSPDGQRIAFISDQNAPPRVWMISVGGGAAQPLEKTNASETDYGLAWWPSSDIVYQQSGNRNFLRVNDKTNEEKPIIQHAEGRFAIRPVFSPDGKKMAVNWIRRENGGLWIVSQEPYSETFLQSGDIFPVGWSPDGRYVYAMRPNLGSTQEIVRVHVTSPNEITSLATLPGHDFQDDGASMSPDGHEMVVVVGEWKSDVWLMENFDPSPR